MTLAKRFFVVAGACVLAIVTFTLSNPRTAHGFAATLVQVTNTSTNPVPTQDVNNGAVSVVNTPTVNIANNASNPLHVQAAAQIPFMIEKSISLNSSDYIGEVSFSVPAGYRLVIENVNADASMGSSSDVPSNIRIYNIFQGGGYYVHHFRIDAHEAGTNNYLSNEQTKFYADGNTPVFVDLIRYTPGSPASADVTITGHLEPTP